MSDTTKTLILRSGGTLSITVSVDLLSLSRQDRAFVFGLIDKLGAYERGEEAKPRGRKPKASKQEPLELRSLTKAGAAEYGRTGVMPTAKALSDPEDAALSPEAEAAIEETIEARTTLANGWPELPPEFAPRAPPGTKVRGPNGEREGA